MDGGIAASSGPARSSIRRRLRRTGHHWPHHDHARVVRVVRVVRVLRVVLVLRRRVPHGNHDAPVAAGNNDPCRRPHPHAHPAAAAATPRDSGVRAARTTAAATTAAVPATADTADRFAAGADTARGVLRRRAGVAGDLREGLLEAALDVGEGHHEQGSFVPAGEDDLLLVAGVEEGQALVDVAEVHHWLAF